MMTNHVHLVATPAAEDSLAKAVGRTHWLYSQTINRLHGRSGHLWQGRFCSCAMDDPHFWAAVKYVERNPVRARLHRKAWLYPWSSAAAHCGMTPGTDATTEGGATAGRAKTGTATPLAVPAFAQSNATQKTGQRRPGRPGLKDEAGLRQTECQSPFSGRDPSGLLDLREWATPWTGEQWQAELTHPDDAEFVERLCSGTGRGRPLGSDSFLSKIEKALGRRVRAMPVGRPKITQAARRKAQRDGRGRKK